MNLEPVKVFYSYSHSDESYRKALVTHLSILRRKGLISEWHDRKIIAGKEWASEINSNIDQSELILLLVSPDFIASDYCYGIEMERAMERHESDKSTVVPIIVRPTDWADTPFAKLQAIPTDAVPVTTWTNEDEAWLDIEKKLKESINEINENKRVYTPEGGLRKLGDLLIEEVDRLDTAIHRTENCTGIPTGFSDLDSILDGMHRSELIVVASRPQMGKTDFVLNLAEYAALKEKLPVAFYSLRLSAAKISRKFTSSLGRIDSARLQQADIDDNEWPRLTSAVSILNESSIFISDKPILTIDGFAKEIKEFKEKHGTGLVIIDGVKNIVEESGSPSNPIRISNKLKLLAREFDLPIVVTLSLGRDLEKRPNKRPVLSDMGEWDILTEDSDVILILYRDEVYDDESPDRGIAEVLIDKNSSGRIGTIRLVYFGAHSRFENFTAIDSHPS
jgi:replicative DNA helicase